MHASTDTYTKTGIWYASWHPLASTCHTLEYVLLTFIWPLTQDQCTVLSGIATKITETHMLTLHVKVHIIGWVLSVSHQYLNTATDMAQMYTVHLSDNKWAYFQLALHFLDD